MRDEKIRVAYGTGTQLGLMSKKKIEAEATTAHFLTEKKCDYNCDYCSQASS